MQSGLLLCPVDELDAALRFYTTALGLPLKFRDGVRYAALDAGGYTLALAAAGERMVEQAAPVFRTTDAAATLRDLLAAGATVVRPLQQGPHESRAVLQAPGGGLLVLSARRTV